MSPLQSIPLVVLADDDPMIHQIMQHHLHSWGYRMAGALDLCQLHALLDQELPVALILDLFLGETNGLDLLPQILERWPGLPVIMLSARGSIDSAVAAIKQGAYDFLTKPAELQRLRIALVHAVERQGLNDRIRRLEELVDDQANAGRLWGDSPAMRQLLALIASVAPTDATALILGESGTGKELVARALHEQSPRSKGPFIPVNMAALPRELVESTLFGHEKGAFTGAVQAQLGCCEAADKGTLFLDEIGEMDMGLQAKLLRFLQERTVTRVGSNKPRQVDVRVVAATNRDLLDQAAKGLFREDLYYRLNVVPMHLPPLRERREDIPLLAMRFLQRLAVKYHKAVRGFTPDAMELLSRHDWPGNVRQLENLVERIVILSTGTHIGISELPAEYRPGIAAGSSKPPSRSVPIVSIPKPPVAPLPFAAPPVEPSGLLRPIDEVERQAICQALIQSGGNVGDAARLLGLGQATVYRKIKRYDISPRDLVRQNPADLTGAISG